MQPRDEGACAFYDELAEDYHLIFDDWWAAATRHGELIGALLRRFAITPPERVLDCTCGIGTQALTLAAQGYRVVGTDLSDEAIRRAGREAAQRDIAIQLAVADVRHVRSAVDAEFAAVISCDNSLPHLLTDDDLVGALLQVKACLHPGGLFLASIRDYDRLAAERPSGNTPVLYTDADTGARRIVGQAWSWSPDARTVGIELFILRDQGDGAWSCAVRPARYRALRRGEMDTALERSGFADVTWHEPVDTGYYQPIVTARPVPAVECA